jgi:hypothetical protein
VAWWAVTANASVQVFTLGIKSGRISIPVMQLVL